MQQTKTSVYTVVVADLQLQGAFHSGLMVSAFDLMRCQRTVCSATNVRVRAKAKGPRKEWKCKLKVKALARTRLEISAATVQCSNYNCRQRLGHSALTGESRPPSDTCLSYCSDHWLPQGCRCTRVCRPREGEWCTLG
eukprot:8091-Heterococcus_DN1.PRE.5